MRGCLVIVLSCVCVFLSQNRSEELVARRVIGVTCAATAFGVLENK